MTRGVCLEDSRSSKQRAASSAGAPFKRQRAPPVEALDELRGVCCWPLRFVRSIPLLDTSPPFQANAPFFPPLSLLSHKRNAGQFFFFPPKLLKSTKERQRGHLRSLPLVSVKSLFFFCDYFLFSKNRNENFRNNALALFLGFFFHATFRTRWVLADSVSRHVRVSQTEPAVPGSWAAVALCGRSSAASSQLLLPVHD